MRSSSMTIATTVRLNNGVPMPVLGLGTWQMYGDTVRRSVAAALGIGYRLVDTASAYENEVEVGEGVRESGVPREELFITTKLWSDEHGYQEALAACARSLDRLGLDHLDLYLIHWPGGGRNAETWEAMVDLMREGKTRAIGVSNFGMAEIEPLVQETGVVPAVNQVEYNPYGHDDDLLREGRAAGIQLEAYSPLRGTNLRDPVVVRIAQAHERTPAQVVLRWALQKGTVVLAKSVHPQRLRENASIFDFLLTEGEVGELDRLG